MMAAVGFVAGAVIGFAATVFLRGISQAEEPVGTASHPTELPSGPQPGDWLINPAAGTITVFGEWRDWAHG